VVHAGGSLAFKLRFDKKRGMRSLLRFKCLYAANRVGLLHIDIRDVLNLQTYLSISEYVFAFASLSPRITALPIAVTDRSSRRASDIIVTPNSLTAQ
jgi:hypothetical protein